MKVIGITGGVGAGKSEILSYLKKHYNCHIIMADLLAHDLQEPGGICYESIVALLGDEVVASDGRIDRARMAEKIFGDSSLRGQVNGIVHPAVKEVVRQEIAKAREEGKYDYLFLEAALLIEDGYERIVDEMWYIHTDADVRRSRLKASRGYSDEKIDNILRGQLSEAEYYRHCRTVIDNSGELKSVYKQIDEKLGENLCQK